MTEFSPTQEPSADAGAVIGGNVLILAAEAEIAQLRAADAHGLFAQVRCHAARPDEPVQRDMLDAASLVVLEVDPLIPASLDRVRNIRASHPSLPLIAAIRGADVATIRTLVRQGVADVAQLPFLPGELASQIRDAGTRLEPVQGKAQLAPLYCVAGGTGGCGTTTVITHMAALLASVHGLRVCVLDLDLQSGEVAYYVGQHPRVTVESLVHAGERIDAQFLQSALTDSGHGFSVIAAPERVTPLDEFEVDELLEIVSILRQQFDLVIVDLPSDWTNWSLSVASAASELIVVTELSVACLRQTKRRLELFESIGIDPDSVRLVANRVEHRMFNAIGLEDAERALGHPFVAALSDEGDAMGSAQDEGRLLFDLRRKTRFETELEALVSKLLQEGK